MHNEEYFKICKSKNTTRTNDRDHSMSVLLFQDEENVVKLKHTITKCDHVSQTACELAKGIRKVGKF